LRRLSTSAVTGTPSHSESETSIGASADTRRALRASHRFRDECGDDAGAMPVEAGLGPGRI
jgi:hypothetical protein